MTVALLTFPGGMLAQVVIEEELELTPDSPLMPTQIMQETTQPMLMASTPIHISPKPGRCCWSSSRPVSG